MWWNRLAAFANRVIHEIDDVRKVLLLLLGAFAFGFGLGLGTGEVWRVLLAASGRGGEPQQCDVLAEITEVQAAYDAQLEPVQDRWLRLTEALERDDMLPSTRAKAEETARMVRDEMERVRGAHRQLMEQLSQSCAKI